MGLPVQVPGMVAVGLLCVAFLAGVRGSPLLTFSCQGNQEVAVISNETGQTLQSICGDDAEITFTASSQGADFSISYLPFGSYTPPIELYRQTIYGTLDQSIVLYKTVGASDLPCGTGQLVATADDYALGKTSVSERVAVVCNNSDVNVRLVVERDEMTTMGYYTGQSIPTLKADGMTSVQDQLQYSGNGIKRIYLENYNRELPSVTMDVPHTVMMYLRARHAPRRNIKDCHTPDFSIFDEIISGYNFTTNFYGHHDVTYEVNGMISTESKVCGDAELVIMFDALHTDLDNDTCDNFDVREVYVDCSHKMHHEDKCQYVPHESYGGTELMMTYGTNDVFMYQFWENKWEEYSRYTMPQDQLTGLSRFFLLTKIMKDIPMQGDEGLCDVKEPFHDIDFSMRYADQPHIPPDPTLGWRISSLKDRIRGYTGNLSLWYDIDALRQEADMDPDANMKMYKYGAAYGLNASLNYHYHKQMYKMYGMSMPPNMTRLYLGPSLWHAGWTAQQMFSSDDAWGMKEAGMRAQATVFSALHLLDIMEDDLSMNTSHHVRSVLNTVADMISQKMSPSTTMPPVMSECPYEKRILPAAAALLFLGAGYGGKIDKHMDDGERCKQQFLYNYFRKGGARVHGRDFPDMRAKTGKKLDMQCRRHPLMGHGGPYVMWKMDDMGRIWKGIYSPLTKAVAWKPMATCKCDSCHSYYTATASPWMGSRPYTTSGYMWHQQTSSPHNYMGYQTTYPNMGK